MAHFPIHGGLLEQDEVRFRGLPEAGTTGELLPQLRLQTADGRVGLLIEFPDNLTMTARSWSAAGVLLPPIRNRLPVKLGPGVVEITIRITRRIFAVSCNGGDALDLPCGLQPVDLRGVVLFGLREETLAHRGSSLYFLDWRRAAAPSGLATTTRAFPPRTKLRPGVSFIVRAKNEEQNVTSCLVSIAPLVEEVIFVDNGSTDNTLELAREMASQLPNIKVFSYPIVIPRVGEQHSEAVLARSKNTLAEYYNWCLNKSTCYNFTKWDADFVAIQDNLREMYSALDLATRGDNICLYYSGIEIYHDAGRWWIDTGTMQHEYRLFSRKHGCGWVDIPPWEEIDQTYLLKGRKEYFLKPIYVEIFRLDRDHFSSRGAYLADKRDRLRFENVARYKANGSLPDNFIEISGPDDPIFRSMELTIEQTHMRDRAHRIWNAVPPIQIGERFLTHPGSIVPQVKLLVAIISCAKNQDLQDRITRTWATDLMKVGITFHFVVGRPGEPSGIDDDVLYLDCPDTYEGLPLKTLALMKHFAGTDFDFLLKIDDDTVLDVDSIWTTGFWRHEYFGGAIAGQWGIQSDWHFGKCENDALNSEAYRGEFRGAWYAGGCGYFVSRNAARAASELAECFRDELYEDKALGDALRKSAIVEGDLIEHFGCVSVEQVDAGTGPAEALLCYDVPRTANCELIVKALRSRPGRNRGAVDMGIEPTGALKVTTDWCLPDSFFRNELAGLGR